MRQGFNAASDITPPPLTSASATEQREIDSIKFLILFHRGHDKFSAVMLFEERKGVGEREEEREREAEIGEEAREKFTLFYICKI